MAKRGQGAAIFLAGASIAASIVFFALGNNTAGIAFLGVPLVQLILAFIPSIHKDKSDKDD